MSAIVGIRKTRTAVDPDEIHRMLSTMPYRCVDGEGVSCTGVMGVGHGMMHTTPESLAEDQPTTFEECTITADARIDNRDELIEILELKRQAADLSDSDLIIRAYVHWGEECVDHLVGDFAFAILDHAEQMLFCARDHFGIRPFYYSYVAGRAFFFASEIRALLVNDGVPDKLDDTRILDALLDLRGDIERTAYESVKRLPPAHLLVVDSDGLRTRKYYAPAPSSEVGTDWSEERYVDRFRELFEQAVRCRTRSAFRVGSELSGGLDSSYVTATARDVISQSDRTEREPLHTFSLTFDDVPESDERPYINAVIQEGDVNAHFVHGDQRGPLTHFDDASAAMDDCIGGGTQFMAYELQSAAHREGVRVLLNGIDGDTVVGHGTMRFRQLAEQGDWETFAREAVAASTKYYFADHHHPFEKSLSSDWVILVNYGFPVLDDLVRQGRLVTFFGELRRIRKYYMFKWSAVLQEFGRHWWRMRRASRRALDTEGLLGERLRVIHPKWKKSGFLADRIRQYGVDAYQSTDSRTKQQLKLGSAHMAGGFETYNHMASRNGIEIRYPFMDRRLIEFCLALPLNMSYQKGWTRWIMREAMKTRVPNEVAWRVGKGRMSSVYRHGLFKYDDQRLCDYTLDTGGLKPYVSFSRIKKLVEKRDRLDEAPLIALTTVAEVAAWMRNRPESKAAGK